MHRSKILPQKRRKLSELNRSCLKKDYFWNLQECCRANRSRNKKMTPEEVEMEKALKDPFACAIVNDPR